MSSSGQGVGLQGPMGSMGRPRGSQGVKGWASRTTLQGLRGSTGRFDGFSRVIQEFFADLKRRGSNPCGKPGFLGGP